MRLPRPVEVANLALRFFLELAALAALGYAGFTAELGWAPRLLLGIGVPLVAAVAWGMLRVPDDPGPAPVAVDGRLRLLIEALVLGGAVAALYLAGRPTLATVFAAVLVAHYVLLAERVARLWRHR